MCENLDAAIERVIEGGLVVLDPDNEDEILKFLDELEPDFRTKILVKASKNVVIPSWYLDEISILLNNKNKYYGDSWQEIGTLGIIYRIKDKCNRLINMIVNKLGEDEDIREEVKDIVGYALLLWKNEVESGRRW